jgi:hypothetical protein
MTGANENTAAWLSEELSKIGSSDNLHISPFREDGKTYGTPTWIWSIVVDDNLYVRADNGRQSAGIRRPWPKKAGRITAAGMTKDVVFEAVAGTINDRIDDAYRSKYRTSPYLHHMISERAKSATVELIPRFDAGSGGD